MSWFTQEQINKILGSGIENWYHPIPLGSVENNKFVICYNLLDNNYDLYFVTEDFLIHIGEDSTYPYERDLNRNLTVSVMPMVDAARLIRESWL